MACAKLCKQCSSVLTTDEIAIYMKLVSRTAREFLCLECLGKKLGCGTQPLKDRIQYYRESGNCSLFR